MQIAVARRRLHPVRGRSIAAGDGSKRSRDKIDAMRIRLYDGMTANGITGRNGRRDLREDQGIRRVRLRRVALDQLRAAGVRLVLAQAALSRRRSARRCSMRSRWASTPRSHSSTTRSGTASRCARRRSSLSPAGASLESRATGASQCACLDAPQPAVRLGLSSVRSIGTDLADAIVASRDAGRPVHLDGRPRAAGRAVGRPGRGAGHLRRVRLLRPAAARGAVGAPARRRPPVPGSSTSRRSPRSRRPASRR